MAPLSVFPFPLPSVPPAGYGWTEREFSESPTTTAFNSGIDQRDIFFGKRACVICGIPSRCTLKHCHIISESEPENWSDLTARSWLPPQVKILPEHEPRNGMIMCGNHQLSFNAYCFFIRFFPDTRRFVFVNYSGHPDFQQFHGKAIALDINDQHAPFPSLFIIHEMRVRGFYPFEPVAPAIPDDSPWQDWIMSSGVFNNESRIFNRSSPPRKGSDSNCSLTPRAQAVRRLANMRSR